MKRQLHWYARDVEAYGRDTAHLSLAEHGAYNLLLDHYYATKGPIPSGIDLGRVCRAMNDAELAAVAVVADQFFPVSAEDGKRHNARADSEIAKSFEINDKRKAAGKLANEVRWATDPKTIPSGIPNGSTPTPTPTVIQDQHLSSPPSAETVPACDFDSIVELYEEALPSCPRVAALSEARRAKIRARWRERWELNGKQGAARDSADLLNWSAKFFGHVAASDFLTGKSTPTPGRPPFVASLDWLMTQGNFLKVIEGSYHR